MRASYCPHCGGALDVYDVRTGGKCSSCRLVVGAGRARDQALDDVRSGGFMANAARREAAEPVDGEAAFVALRAVAEDKGCAVERLRMTDYDTAIRAGSPGPTVAEILATFDTWKAARAAAGVPREAEAVGAGEDADGAGARG